MLFKNQSDEMGHKIMVVIKIPRVNTGLISITKKDLTSNFLISYLLTY